MNGPPVLVALYAAILLMALAGAIIYTIITQYLNDPWWKKAYMLLLLMVTVGFATILLLYTASYYFNLTINLKGMFS